MFSNHFDALPFDNGDRRIQPIENPSERLPVEYYDYIYKLLRIPSFIDSVRHYLQTYDISTFNPGAHATLNKAKHKSLQSMMSEPDKAVAEFKTVWEGDVTTVRIVKQYVSDFMGGGMVNDNQMRHAMKRAGMELSPGRIMIGTQKERIVALNGTSIVDVMMSEPDQLRRIVSDATARMVFSAGI